MNQSQISIQQTKYSYEPRKLLGKGFGGTVYKGKDNSTNTSVAIKILNHKNFI